MKERQRYRYVGPDEIRDSPAGTVAMDIITTADLRSWMNAQQHDPDEMVTFIVTVAGKLRVAPRRSEHVACARGNDVLAAGEMTFGRSEFGWSVTEVTNQSTGYCPDTDCWPAVAAALNRADVSHPGAFTYQVVFRRCPSCNERNIVHERDFTCALCEHPLPLHWNFPVV